MSDPMWANNIRLKSVVLKGVGVFTVREWSLEAGIRRYLDHYEPVFILSKELLEEFDLHQRKQYFTDRISVVPLNVCELARQCDCTKQTAIFCYDEIVHSLRRLIADGKGLTLELPQLGKLTISGGSVNFQFVGDLRRSEKEPDKICTKHKTASQPYHPKKIYPCPIHSHPVT